MRLVWLGLLLSLSWQGRVYASALPEFRLEIRQHLFYPSWLEVPARQRFVLVIDNRDRTPEEFESGALNRKKIIPGQQQVRLVVGPLLAGSYPFYGEFFPKTAQGLIQAQEAPCCIR